MGICCVQANRHTYSNSLHWYEYCPRVTYPFLNLKHFSKLYTSYTKHFLSILLPLNLKSNFPRSLLLFSFSFFLLSFLKYSFTYIFSRTFLIMLRLWVAEQVFSALITYDTLLRLSCSTFKKYTERLRIESTVLQSFTVQLVGNLR